MDDKSEVSATNIQPFQTLNEDFQANQSGAPSLEKITPKSWNLGLSEAMLKDYVEQP